MQRSSSGVDRRSVDTAAHRQIDGFRTASTSLRRAGPIGSASRTEASIFNRLNHWRTGHISRPPDSRPPDCEATPGPVRARL